MEIIEATESHVPELVELWVEFFDYHRDIDPYYTRSEDARVHIEKRFREKIAAADSCVLAALDAGRVIGYSLSWINDNSPYVREKQHGFICDLAVAYGHRGSGTGEGLLERTLAWFRTRGIRRIVIYALIGNRRAVAFWSRHGFDATNQCMERLIETDYEDV